jgi:uncharacterized protein YjiS (DUF1127 family)
VSVHSLPLIRIAPSRAWRDAAREGWALLVEMIRARRTRRLLAEMEDRMLADIGVGRGEALMESSRPMWDLGER